MQPKITFPVFVPLPEAQAPAEQSEDYSFFKMPASNPHGIALDEHGFPIPESLERWHAEHNDIESEAQ